MKDKYKAVWLSHSSINDFLECPRAYYLKNIYKDKRTGNKVGIASPALSLGQAVHEVLESLSTIPTHKRFETPLIDRFETAWEKVSGKRGGFTSNEVEKEYKQRGIDMINRVRTNPGPLKNKAVKNEEDLPYFWLSEDDNLILCGKIDWLEYLEDINAVNIIDFKTSKEASEDPDSLQLPIYHILARNTQKWDVKKASYWYLNIDDQPVEKELPDYDQSYSKILSIGKKIKLARQLESFNCPNGEEGCKACRQHEKIIKGEAELVYSADRRDIYLIDWNENKSEGVII